MSTQPWGDSTVDSWLFDILCTCVDPDTAETVKPDVKQILFSNQESDALQFPLFELLGDSSFDVIETLLNYREMIKEAYTAKPSTTKKSETVQPKPKKIIPLARRSRYEHTDSINMTRYDVEAPDVERPKVDHVPISSLPTWAQPCFSSCQALNDIQSTVFDQAFNSNENMLVAAPTGAGKTNVALLTILHEIKQHIIEKEGLPTLVDSKDNFLMVYITPMKALATEIKEKFTNALRHLKVNVREYTGDTRIASTELLRSHLLVATPEKWDVATRRGGEDSPSMRIKLLIIDEIHLLQDDRGPVIEALVARTLKQVEQTQSMIRIVGLSATLPNCHDVAHFLRVPDPSLFIFGPEYRPVPLQMTLIGTKNTYKTPPDYDDLFQEVYKPGKDKDIAQIDVVTMELLKEILRTENQVLIFVHSRGETARFANLITKYNKIKVSETLNHLISRRKLQTQLRECLAKGVGIHHAGLPRSDRIFVENAFKSNAFQILVCTATLAWGVNLPAHTCIIKDTKVYNQEHGGFEDIGILDVHQMFGRAGRPQFDKSGHGILITTNRVLSKYTTTLVNAEPINSKFIGKIEDFLNAEISLGTVTCKSDAMQWIRYTFMYERNPNDSDHIKRLDIAENNLNENMMIRTSIATESLQPTHLGQVASIHYIPFTAVKHFNENLRGDMNESELLDCIFNSGMFESLIVRNNEIDELMSFETVIPLLTPPDELPGKVNILFQSYVSRHVFKTPSLNLDQSWIADNMQRVFDAIFELAIEKGWCFVALFSNNCCKMVDHQMWWVPDREDHPLYQVLKAPRFAGLFRRLETLGLSVEKLRTMDFGELKSLLRSDQNAVDAVAAAKRFPVVTIGTRYQPMSDEIISITVEVIFEFSWDKSIVHETEQFWLFIQDADGKKMYNAQEISVDKKTAKEGLEIPVLVPLPESNTYLITISSVRFLGVEDSQQLTIDNDARLTFQRYISVPPKLRPLNVDDVVKDEYSRSIFPFNTFNLIQTQLFFQTYHTDESILLCAPTAAGKTVIAELAITRMLEKSKYAKAVYMVPLKAIVQERVADWKKKFEGLLIELTGDFTPDSDAIARARIIIATPEKWDAVSRGFVVRQFVQFVSLVIIDEVHLLGTDRGHIIEAVVDRMKFLQANLRVIALSTCLSNPLDVAKFLGVPNRGVYNYSPKLRNVPLMTFIRGFPGRHYCPRMAAMNKPLSDSILEHSEGKPTLVFVSSRRQTRLTAFDLISFASSARQPNFYCTQEASDASQLVDDPDLQHCLSFGVGLHHAGLLPHDQQIVEKLFGDGHLKLLVATSTLAWGVNLPAHFVVIKGTEFRDPKTCQWVPYSVTEMQQMMGRAGRPQFDTEGIVMILCEESRKEFLKKFINSPFPVESSLLPHIDDHINAEISTGRIRSKKQLTDWINRSFFGLRLSKNPKYYNDVSIEQVSTETLDDLLTSHCATTNVNGDIKPTAAGKICSIYYVTHKTVRLFLDQMDNVTTIVDVLHLLCNSPEFKDTPVRHNEDDLVGQMTPRFKKLTDDPATSPTKAFYMVQYYLSHRKMPIPDFDSDLSTVLDNLLRISGCYCEICATRKNLKGMLNAILIGQMIVQGIWYDDVPLKALMDEKTMKNLKNKNDIKTLPQLLTMKEIPDNLKSICNRILLYKVSKRGLSEDRTTLSVELTRINGEIGSNVISPHFLRKSIQSLYILIGNPESGELICHRRVQFKRDVMNVVLKSENPIPDDCWIYFMLDAYMGLDQMYSISETPVVKQLYLRPKKIVKFEKKKKTADPKYRYDPSMKPIKEEVKEEELFFGTLGEEIKNPDDNKNEEEEKYEDLATTGKKGRKKLNKKNQFSYQPNNNNNNNSNNNNAQQNEQQQGQSQPNQRNYGQQKYNNKKQQRYNNNNNQQHQGGNNNQQTDDGNGNRNERQYRNNNRGNSDRYRGNNNNNNNNGSSNAPATGNNNGSNRNNERQNGSNGNRNPQQNRGNNQKWNHNNNRGQQNNQQGQQPNSQQGQQQGAQTVQQPPQAAPKPASDWNPQSNDKVQIERPNKNPKKQNIFSYTPSSNNNSGQKQNQFRYTPQPPPDQK
ncbi:hypothetical protein M9Y10_012421 [Tritrichomonas musculus]|uniref:Type III restriction enzyme, res subunit family protein n=1 Tax=Tritrichomonas musculus TaxID=1915356 RepID=A0ABR2ID44_9EUKA